MRNVFGPELSRTTVFQATQARVEDVRVGHSTDTRDRRLFCDITLSTGVKIENVPFYGGGVDLTNSTPHGVFFPPVVGQKIIVFFIDAHWKNPVGCIPIPFPWDSSKDFQKYNDVLDNINDAAIFHKSGTKIIMRANGSVEITNSNQGSFVMNGTTGQVNVNGNLTVDV